MSDRPFSLKLIINLIISFFLVLTLISCGIAPVKAEDRLFLNFSVEFLGEYELPKLTFEDTPVGGLSAITYDRQQNRFYALSDDRSNKAPARFYTLNLHLDSTDTKSIKIDRIEVENVTFLKDEQGNTYSAGTIDPEGMALSPRGTVFISTEGDASKGIDPFIAEFDLKMGVKKLELPLPQRYLPEAGKGVQTNLGFEPLTLNQSGLAAEDPFRLFTATESSLIQDNLEDVTKEARIRLLHYVINPIGSPILVAEHLYLLDPASVETISNGLTELLAMKQEGYFLSLERTFGFTGAGAKLFQVINNNANDTSTIVSLKEDVNQVKPLKKKLVLDLQQLGINLDNLEGMSFGPRLPDDSQSLLLMSDDNFSKEQVNQFLLLRINNLR